MKYTLILGMLLCSVCYGQKKNYKDYNVCTNWDVYKGKKNHGKKYCTGYSTIREYKDGRKDTICWMGGGQIFIGGEYDQYCELNERGKYIVDSLKEDGVTPLQSSYLMYEPIYMKAGKKKEQLWSIEGQRVVIYEYLFWKNKKGNGVELIKEFEAH